jgi:hypothetical protein
LKRRAYSSVGLERTPDKREVGSSNLPRPTNTKQKVEGRTQKEDATHPLDF